jgi:predicted Zn finger-like uncharacterized protein
MFKLCEKEMFCCTEYMMTYYCQNCRERINIDSGGLPRVGNKVKCLKCQNLIDVDKVDYAFS